MESCLKWLCCCLDFEPTPRNRSSRKTRRPAMEYRLNTKYKKEDFVRISDEERKSGKVKAYACPICTYYYNSKSVFT